MARSLKRLEAQTADEFQKKLGLKLSAAILGDANGRVDVQGIPGYVNVRYRQADDFGMPTQLPFRAIMNKTPGAGCIVGYDPADDTLCVLRPDFEAQRAAGTNPITNNYNDPSVFYWIAQERLMTLASLPVSSAGNSMLVTVMSWIMIDLSTDTATRFAGDKIDLTAYIPGSSSQWCLACLFWKADNTIEVVASTPRSNPTDIGMTDVSECLAGRSAGSLPIWAWRLYNGQTGITPGPTSNGGDDFLDLRQIVNNVNGSGSSGGMTDFTVAADSGTPQTISDGNTLTIAGGTGLSSVASAADTVTVNLDTPVALAHGGTHADLSATGGANQFLKQSSAGADITVGTIADADVPDALTISGGTINNTPIGATTASTLIASAISLLIGGFKAIFTHANSADRTYTLPNATTTLVGTDVTQTLTNKKFDDGIVVNETGADSDTRIEGDTNANLFFVDASTDRIGIGTNVPSVRLDVRGDTIISTGDFLVYEVGDTAALTVDNSSGAVTINDGGVSTGDFTVEGDTNAVLLTTDASADAVGIGTAIPNASTILHVVSTEKGTVTAPVMTASQRDAISSPTTGLQAFTSDTYQLSQYDSARYKSVNNVGFVPYAMPIGLSSSITASTNNALAANGGSHAMPIMLSGHMLLQSVSNRNGNTSLAHTWGWDLYLDDLDNSNTLRRVAASTADETFTPAAASTRTIAVASAPVYLAPGLYWLVIQNRHATNTYNLLSDTPWVAFADWTQTKTTTNPNGSTLDFVAATWTKSVLVPLARLEGRVFGQSVSF